MKDTEIVEVLPDGTVYHFDMDVCNAEADRMFDALWLKEDNQMGYDYTATVFSVFARAIHVLSMSGWTTEELLDTVLTHTELEDDE